MRRFVFLSLVLATFTIGAGCDKKADTGAKSAPSGPSVDPAAAVGGKAPPVAK